MKSNEHLTYRNFKCIRTHLLNVEGNLRMARSLTRVREFKVLSGLRDPGARFVTAHGRLYKVVIVCHSALSEIVMIETTLYILHVSNHLISMSECVPLMYILLININLTHIKYVFHLDKPKSEP